MDRYSIYAVASGRDPVTGREVSGLKFTSWNEAKKYVTSKDITNAANARYKGFLTEAEADAWLLKQQESRKTAHGSTAGKNNDAGFIKACASAGKDPDVVLGTFKEWFAKLFI